MADNWDEPDGQTRSMSQIDIVKKIADEMIEIGEVQTNEKFYIEFDERLRGALGIILRDHQDADMKPEYDFIGAVRGKYVIIKREDFEEAIRMLKVHAYSRLCFDAQNPQSPDDAIAFDCAVIIKLLGGVLDK